MNNSMRIRIAAIAAFSSGLIVLLSASALAGLSHNVSADIRLGYGTATQESLRQENIDQEYNLNWQKSIMRSLITKASLRYYNFGVKEINGPNSWRSDFQPSGEVSFRQGWFGMSAQGFRRDSKTNLLNSHVVNKSAGLAMRTQPVRYPWVKARIQHEELVNVSDPSDRDTRDRTASMSVGVTRTSTSASYSYSYRNSLDRSQKIELTNNFHTLQLDHSTMFFNQRLRSSLSYSFSYRRESDRNLAFDPIPFEISAFVGLYADDPTPDLGSLDTVSTLIDGNTAIPTLTRIDIGNNEVNKNIGADLGFQQDVNELHVYTDRPSGNSVRWEVFHSQDNTVWEPVANSSSTFSPGFSRYEIEFPVTNTRYIKAVNHGLNEFDSVYVTELVVLRQLDAIGVATRDQSIHLASLNNNMILSEAWSTNAGVSLRRDAGNVISRGRDETYYSFGLRNKISPTASHNARVQIGLIDFEQATYDVDKTVAVNYDLQYHPLTTLDISITLSHRDNYIVGVQSQEVNNGTFKMRGQILPRLSVASEFSGGRNTLMFSNTGFDNWNYRTSLEGRVTTELDASANYSHQVSVDLADNKRVKDQYGLVFGYLITHNMQLRGNIDLTHDGNSRYISQDYSFGWVLSPKLSAGAAVYLSDFHNGVDSKSERYSAQLEYSLSQRTVLSGSYSENDLSSTEGASNRSVRVGVRTGL